MNINKNNYEAYFLDYHEGNLSPQQVADLFLFLTQHPELKKELDDFENVELNDFSTPVFENKESLKKIITPDNQEEYFIQAVEGTLSTSELILLHSHLDANPELLKEFNLFQKTKLLADPSLVFENKNELKQLSEEDHLLVASIEGLLAKKEQTQLEKKLAYNSELKKVYLLYQQTKLVADSSIVFPDKQLLKRKQRKIDPLFYYISSAAATIAILIGLFFFFKTTATFHTTGEHQAAQQKDVHAIQPVAIVPSKTIELVSKPRIVKVNTRVTKNMQQPKTEESKNKVVPVVILKPSTEDLQAFQEKLNTAPPIDSALLQQDNNIKPAVAKIEKKPEQLKTAAFHSVQDILAGKLKEKLIGKEITQDKSNIISAKITGWDIAGVFAKKLSNMTGKKIAIKPKFNKQGEVTAYAFSAGKLEFSRIK